MKHVIGELDNAIEKVLNSAEDTSEAVALVCHTLHCRGITFDFIARVANDLQAEPENLLPIEKFPFRAP